MMSGNEAPFWCHSCARGEHDACAGIAWQPDIECECSHPKRTIWQRWTDFVVRVGIGF